MCVCMYSEVDARAMSKKMQMLVDEGLPFEPDGRLQEQHRHKLFSAFTQ